MRDRKAQERRGGRLDSVLTFLAFAAAGALVGTAVIWIVGEDSGEGISAWLFLAALVPTILLVLGAHEAGHLLGGRLAGFRFLLFVLGPLKVTASGAGAPRIGLNRSLALYGGMAGSLPVGTHGSARRMAIMVAGGPGASLLLGITAAGLALDLDGPAGPVLLLAAATSLAIFVITLIPNRFGGLVSDGARLLMLLRGGPEGERWCALAAVAAASMSGQRPRDWDATLLERMLSPADGSFDDAGASLLAYYHALDKDDVERGERFLRRALDAKSPVPGVLRAQVLHEAAFFEAYFRGDAPAARALLESPEEARKKVMERHIRFRAEAAVLLAEGETGVTRERAGEALEVLRRSYDPGAAHLETEWLEDIVSLSRDDRPR